MQSENGSRRDFLKTCAVWVAAPTAFSAASSILLLVERLAMPPQVDGMVLRE